MTTKTTKNSTVDPEEAVNSQAFQQAKNKAEEYARDPEKAQNLVDKAIKKAKGRNKGQLDQALDEFWGYLTALIRLARAYYTKQYTDVPWKSIALVIAAIIYFVSPIDLIPDFIPILGLSDDAIVIAFVVKQIQSDLDNFLAWEITQENTIAEPEDTEN
ncbi:MAG: YkvA family protein [Anaerolineae bacterium]|jgi:uncharacterized membrane protein YkvA (DUF1232 family)|nr:YkvA family protein [Anaerolineae bacterium]